MKNIHSPVRLGHWPTRVGKLSIGCALVSLLAWSGCNKPDASTSSPPVVKKEKAASPAEEPAAVVTSTETPEVETPAAAPADATATAEMPKGLDKIIKALDDHAENYGRKFTKIPTIAELKAWKDKDSPLLLPAWPEPPPGKKWVINPQTGMFRVENAK